MMSVGDAFNRSATWVGVSVGRRASSVAAHPLTCEAACDVPLNVAVPETRPVEVTAEPGATRSSVSSPFVKQASSLKLGISLQLPQSNVALEVKS
jgi:hypothetical protein